MACKDLPETTADSHGGHDTLGMDLVHGEGIGLSVVGADTVGSAEGLEGLGVALVGILGHDAHIILGEVGVETGLNVLDFPGAGGVIVEGSGAVNEFIVEAGLQEHLEVGHESGVEAELVLSEQGHQTGVALLLNLVASGDRGHVGSKLDHGNYGETIQVASHTDLNIESQTAWGNLHRSGTWRAS